MTRFVLTGMAFVALNALQMSMTPQAAVAALIASENFESYTTGSSVAGGIGGTGSWSGAWSSAGGTPNIASGIVSGFGKSLELAPAVGTHSNNVAFRQFTLPSQTGPVYVGFVLQTNSTFSGNDFFQFFLDNDTSGLINDSADADNSFSAIVRDATTYGIRKGAAGGGRESTAVSPSHANDVATRLVLKISKSTGLAADNYDELELFVDGISVLLRDSTTADSTILGPTLSTLHFRLSSLESADRVYIDDLRIATTYAAAVPEPSGILLASVGVVLGVAVFRKRA